MDSRKSNKGIQSHFPGTKSSTTYLLILMLMTYVGCSTANKTSSGGPDYQIPKNYELPETRTLTLMGENRSPQFVPNSNILLFLSKSRTAHSHFQVYEKDLEKNRERRITFHDGDDHGLTISPDGQRILYASTTDENKENPLFIQKALGDLKKQQPVAPQTPWTVQPFELYDSTRDGREIRRLTDNAGFDSQGHHSSDGKEVVFSSNRGKTFQLYRLDLKDLKVRKVISSTNHQIDPAIAGDGTLAWVEYSTDFTTSYLKIREKGSNKQKTLLEGSFHIRHPSWSQSSELILFATDKAHAGNLEIYSIARDSTCLNRLTFHKASDTEPVFHADDSKFAFVSLRLGGGQQIFSRTYLPPNPCLKIKGEVK